MFDMEKLKDKIVMAYAGDEFYDRYYMGLEDDISATNVESYYVFDTVQEFITYWEENANEGSWYWVYDHGNLICSGACAPEDMDIFEDYWGLK